MAERQYYNDKFEFSKGNINKTWQTINSVIAGTSYKNDKHIKEIKIDNKIVADNQVIASVILV